MWFCRGLEATHFIGEILRGIYRYYICIYIYLSYTVPCGTRFLQCAESHLLVPNGIASLRRERGPGCWRPGAREARVHLGLVHGGCPKWLVTLENPFKYRCFWGNYPHELSETTISTCRYQYVDILRYI